LPGITSTDDVHDSPGASFCGFTACAWRAGAEEEKETAETTDEEEEEEKSERV
jgi:hypothetical protein